MNPMFALFIVALVCIVLIQAEDWRRVIARRLAPRAGSTLAQQMSDAELDTRIAELEAELRPSKSRTAPAPLRAEIAAPRFQEPTVYEEVFDLVAEAPQAPQVMGNVLNVITGFWHLFIYGPTGTGKTTFIHGLTAQLVKKGARVLVLDIQLTPGTWPGCEVYGFHKDLGHIREGIDAFVAEADDRDKLRAAGRLAELRQKEPWVLVVEEAKNTFLEFDGLAAQIVKSTELYRKLGMFIVLGSQSSMGDLGVGYITAFRSNFAFLVELIDPKHNDMRREADVRSGTAHIKSPAERCTVPFLTDWEDYVNPDDPRYLDYKASHREDEDFLERELGRSFEPSMPKARSTEQLADELTGLVVKMATQLPAQGEVTEEDYDLIPGIKHQGDAWLTVPAFDGLLDHLGAADRKRELVDHLLERGILEPQGPMPTYNVKIAKRPTRTYRFKVTKLQVTGLQSPITA